jgi:hypothetical protein
MTKFLVDLYNTRGDAKLGIGPLANITYVEQTEYIDQAGNLRFGVPATDIEAIGYLRNECLAFVKTEEGYWPPGIVRSRGLALTPTPTYDVSGPDILGELGQLSTELAREYSDEYASGIIQDLISTWIDPLWAYSYLFGDDPQITHRFDGETLLAAVMFVVQRLDLHFRLKLGTPAGVDFRYIVIDDFGDDCGLRLINVQQQRYEQQSNTDIALLRDLELVEESSRIVNWLLPLGAGDGRGQLTMMLCDSLHGGPTTPVGGYRVKVKAGINRASTHGYGTIGQMIFYPHTAADFVVDDPIYINTDSYGYGGEYNEVASVGPGNQIGLKAPLLHTWTDPTPIYAWPEFYIEDTDSQTALGCVHQIVQAWKDIGPIDNTDVAVVAAANTLYDVASAYLRKNKQSSVTYRASVPWLDWTVRAGDAIRLVYRGVVTRDGTPYTFIDVDDLYTIMSITRRLEATGAMQTTLEIASVDKSPLDNIGAVVHALKSVGDWEIRTQNYPCIVQDTGIGVLHGNAYKFYYTPVRFNAGTFMIGMRLDRATLTFKTGVMYYTSPGFIVALDTVYPEQVSLWLANEAGVETDLTALLGGPWGVNNASVERTLDVTQFLRNANGGLKQSHRFAWKVPHAGVYRGIIEVTLRMAFTSQSYVRG